MNGEGEEVEKREKWDNKVEFILATLGYCVGIGALTRFPYICMKNGGGAFLIPFTLFMVTAGAPLFYIELILGQFSAKSPLILFPAMGPAFKGLGISVTLLSGIVAIYYMQLTWSVFYLVTSLSGPVVPWATCGNWWNTDSCYVPNTNNSAGNDTLIFGNESNLTNITIDRVSPTEEFWNEFILGIAPSINDIGGIRWQLAVSHFICWTAVFFATMKGVKSAGKVVYVTATLPFVLIGILLGYGATLEGSLQGIIFFLNPDFSRLGDVNVWLEAAIQVMFQLGPAWGGVLTMASYNKFHNKCYRDALLITFLNFFTAIYSGLTIFSILGFMAHRYNKDVGEVAKSGPGLAFVAYPEAIAQMPISPFFAAIFFLTIITIGIDSQFGMFDTLVSGILDSFPHLRKRKVFVTLGAACCMFLLGLPFCTDIGMYLYQIFDWYAAALTFMMVGFSETVIVCYVYGIRRFCQDAQLMFGRKPRIGVRFMWLFVTPLVLGVVLFAGIWNLEAPVYEYKGKTAYPRWAIGMGWALALVSFLPTPITLVVVVLLVFLGKPGRWIDKLHYCFTPTEDWIPDDPTLVEDYTKKWYGGSAEVETYEDVPPAYPGVIYANGKPHVKNDNSEVTMTEL